MPPKARQPELEVVQIPPMSMSVDSAATFTGLGRSTLYTLIKAGELKASRIGGRTLILRADLEELVAKYRVDDWSKLQAELKAKKAGTTAAA